MSKVAIVGVEGSGKTVLMAVLGDRYAQGTDGVLLRPLNRETYKYYTSEAENLRNGKWPLATSADTSKNLEWSLMLQGRKDASPTELCTLSFLDYGGEVYRLAFGGARPSERNMLFKDSIAALKSHVRNADALVVLVNLSDIINGTAQDEKSIETGWLSQAILAYAFAQGEKKRVALVFSQSDAYAQTISRCGGIRGTLKRYLREVDAAFGNRLKLFAVSAVKTKAAPDGFAVPDGRLDSTGIEALMKWIADATMKNADVSNDPASVKREKWRMPRWIGRLFAWGYCLSACAAGCVCGWHLYADIYRNADRAALAKKNVDLAKERVDDLWRALSKDDANAFKELLVIPDGVEEFWGVDRTTAVQNFARQRGMVWDSLHGCGHQTSSTSVRLCFSCSLFGKRTNVFECDADANAKNNAYHGPVAFGAREDGGNWKTVWVDIDKGSDTKEPEPVRSL